MAKSKEKIVYALLFLLNEKSILEINNGEIIKKSGVAKGTFYHYFQSKHDIIKYAAQLLNHEIVHGFIKRYRELDLHGMTPDILIDVFSDVAVPIIYENRDQIRVLHSSDVNEIWRNIIGKHCLLIMRKLFPDCSDFNLQLFNRYVYMMIAFWITNLIPNPQDNFKTNFKLSLTITMIETLK